jgi:hypothetical protein
MSFIRGKSLMSEKSGTEVPGLSSATIGAHKSGHDLDAQMVSKVLLSLASWILSTPRRRNVWQGKAVSAPGIY